MLKLRIFKSRKGIDDCKLYKIDDKIYILCGDYIRVVDEIKKLWNEGVSPKSYLSEIARQLNKDKSWVLEIITKLMNNKIISKYIADGYKKKALYKLNKKLEEFSMSETYMNIGDYRLFDVMLLISVMIVAWLSSIYKDMTLLIIWSVLVPLIELVLHMK